MVAGASESRDQRASVVSTSRPFVDCSRGRFAHHWALRIVSISKVFKKGIFNPYTKSGSIVVNGIHALCASKSFADAWIHERFVPTFYDYFLKPIYWLYSYDPNRMKALHAQWDERDMSENIIDTLSMYMRS